MKPGDTYTPHDCRPVGEILNQIGGKWTVLIITRLKHGPMRFSELKRLIGGISQKVLTATLRELEMNGFVTRTVTPSIPPRVDYELTDLGRELLVPLDAVSEWALANRQRVLDARKAFFEQNPDAVPPRIGQVATLIHSGNSSDSSAPVAGG
ncbi:winged helix-turn-helix transcriptional regulator [Devosia nitrariae]|uniref:HxlR family transcriptional regulator n=1 Tax=Devosia nitrariae TaxID=2071872 RepID=A0ABQ5W4A3_9HYPH|nr:helix-turn-helix domain-containing protein [Devosia nitrariae]GLQ54641.1 HxlR family transcriptional regulator [Devosia nitrariae]